MAVAVASVESAWVEPASTLTIAKPSGLAVGDLLFAVIGHFRSVSAVPSGFTLYQSTSSIYTYYKIADSADVSATNFSWTFSQTGVGGGVLCRITGAAGAHAFLYAAGSDTADNQAPEDYVISNTFSLTPLVNDSLIIWVAQSIDPNGERATSFGNWTISGTNPTWTEVLDDAGSYSDNAVGMGVAYAILPDTTERTSASVTVTISPTNSFINCAQLLVVLSPLTNATGTASLLDDAEDTIFVPAGKAGTKGTVGFLGDAEETIFAPTGRIRNNIWTEETKTTTTWTEEEK